MSCLSMRSHMNAGQDGFRDKGSKQQCDLREGPLGLSECLVSWIEESSSASDHRSLLFPKRQNLHMQLVAGF